MDIHWIDQDSNKFKVSVENDEDLWYLSRVISEGDYIEGETERKIDMGDATKSRTVRKTFFLEVEVESVSYDPEMKSFRASGRITSCPDEVSKGSYHSFNVQDGDTITVTKPSLSTFHVKQLKEATSPPSDVLLVLVDRDKARFARMTPSGYEVISTSEGTVEKKAFDQIDVEDFHVRVADQIHSRLKDEEFSSAVIASPGFWKDNVTSNLPSNVKDDIILGTVSRTDNHGFDELLKRPEVETALSSEKSSREARDIEALMQSIRDGKACYGWKSTKEHVDMGSVEKLIVSEDFLAEKKKLGEYSTVDELMQKAEEMGGEVVILSSDDQITKLDGLGGIGAILRWKV